MVPIEIIGCPKWGARPPKQGLIAVRKSKRIIFHHTAGHHAHIPHATSRADAIRYAHAVQDYHMDHNGWNDSGHNFLVMRTGMILQGRWLSISSIQAGHMVRSAHCPGQNDQIGIEHEHQGDEEMTDAQREASARLMAWIADQYGRTVPLPVFPHRKYFATSCPANLVSDIAPIRERAGEILYNALAA